ncbi:MAG: LuxR C-terminal-related transcriptional regulator [Thermodesulfobacteriota bacterium]
MIFDMHNRLLYFNEEAVEMIPELQTIPKRGKQQNIPKAIFNLCKELKENRRTKGPDQKMNVSHNILKGQSLLQFSMRAFFIGGMKDRNPTHIMVLLEKIIPKHEINLEIIQKEFNISKREVEVVKLICEGLANKEISEKLFISEYTVKDHIKNILRKMGVTSRSQIISSLKQ